MRRVYYGWFIVVACNCVAFITWGVGIFNQGIFLGYFVERYGWSTATLIVVAATLIIASIAVR